MRFNIIFIYFFQVFGNDSLFFGDARYTQELVSLSTLILHNMVDIIPQESSQVISSKLCCYYLKVSHVITKMLKI